MTRSIRPSKFGNIRTTVDGQVFQSRREARRYQALRTLERAGKIGDLRCQVPFDIIVNKVKVCRYVADFTYREDAYQIVEDVKGMRTPIYRLKAKLMLACHGIKVKET